MNDANVPLSLRFWRDPNRDKIPGNSLKEKYRNFKNNHLNQIAGHFVKNRPKI